MHPIPTSQEQLRQWLNAPEGSRFEFKEAKNRYDFEKLVEYCFALANEGGGKIILGATDRRPRKVCGSSAFAEPGRTDYASMGAKGVHTRKRGLDHETNKALLLQHLKGQGDLGSPLSELEQVLPALPEHKVQRLLNELKDEHRVILEGTRRWAKWKLAAKTQTPQA